MCDPQKVYEDCLATGTKRWEALQKALESNKQDADRDADYAARYRSDRAQNKNAPANVHAMMATLKLKTDKYEEVMTRASTSAKTVVAYKNYYRADQGVIAATHNYAKDDKNDGRLNLSEILWQEYKRHASSAEQAKNLKYIFRCSLENQHTMMVIKAIFEKRLLSIGDRQNDIDWLPDQHGEWFLALLGTPNCQSIPWLLIDHKNALGSKTIKKITTRYQSHLYLEIG